VEQLYREAVMRAQSQQAKWWELRASVSLARWLLLNDRREEGRAALEPVYGWFKEGFDTLDLVEAKSLLAEV
jgi:predicted ATPase